MLNNPQAEASLLSCLFLAQKGKDKALLERILSLNPDVFYSLLNKTIFLKFKELTAQGYSPDALAIDHFVKDKNIYVLAGGNLCDYIVNTIFDMEITAYAAPLHIDILIDLEKRRSLLNQIKQYDTIYIAKRDALVKALRDTSSTIDETKIFNFLERRNENE